MDNVNSWARSGAKLNNIGEQVNITYQSQSTDFLGTHIIGTGSTKTPCLTQAYFDMLLNCRC